MPHALVLGMTKREFMKSKPCELVAYGIADKIIQKRRDEELWRMGIYVAHALDCTVCNSGLFRGKNSKPHEYPKEPILFANDTQDEDRLQKQRELFVAGLMAMQSNFELEKKRKENEVKDNSVS